MSPAGSLGLGVDDDVGDVRPGAAKTLLDLAGAGMRLRQRARGIEGVQPVRRESGHTCVAVLGQAQRQVGHLAGRDGVDQRGLLA